MTVRDYGPSWWATLAVCVVFLVAGCSGNPLSLKYEYEEEVYVGLDGSATVYVNAAVPALVALRGVNLPLDPRARLDRNDVRAIFESPHAHVASVSLSRRDGRRYVHLRLDVDDLRKLPQAGPFAWSTYGLEASDGTTTYRQHVGEAAAQPVGDVGWRGDELVAFRLHLPSRVSFHNSPSREILRGNIIVWEQPLADRLRSEPIDIDVRMDSDSILEKTLSLFAAMAVLVVLTFAGFIWFIRSRGTADPSA